MMNSRERGLFTQLSLRVSDLENGAAQLEVWKKGVEQKMSDLSDALAAATSALQDEEARVTAHEQAAAQTIMALQGQIAALQAAPAQTPDVTNAIAGLKSLTAQIVAFDPDKPAPIAVSSTPTTTPAPAAATPAPAIASAN